MKEKESTTKNEYRLSKILTPVEEMEFLALLAGVSIEEMLEIAEREVKSKSPAQEDTAAIPPNENSDDVEQPDQEGRI
jgi:hypothetical protein